MPLNMNETIQRIKKAGAQAVRTVPMEGQSVKDGFYKIEVRDGNNWVVLVENIPHNTATDLINQATNRVLLG